MNLTNTKMNYGFRCLLSLIVSLCCIHMISSRALGFERYYIDNQSLLLYKTIIWWYDCQPGDDVLLCGKLIKCVNQDHVKVKYNESDKVVDVHIENGFATLLSVLESRDARTGLFALRCTWHNEKYLGKSRARTITSLDHYSFYPVEKEKAQSLKNLEKKIAVEIEGSILGLTHDGRIALHSTENLLKRCPVDTNKPGRLFPIRMQLRNRETGEIIAQYHAHMAVLRKN